MPRGVYNRSSAKRGKRKRKIGKSKVKRASEPRRYTADEFHAILKKYEALVAD